MGWEAYASMIDNRFFTSLLGFLISTSALTGERLTPTKIVPLISKIVVVVPRAFVVEM